MTYLEILSFARKGVASDQARYREQREKAIAASGEFPAAQKLAECLRVEIEALDVKLAILDEIERLNA